MIRAERDGDVATITIDREERRNALNGDLCTVFTEALLEQQDARAVVVTGAGSVFCAGADLATRFGAGDGEGGTTDTFRPHFEVLLDAIVAHPAPVIAAVNGPAIGAGMQLCVACDLRIARPDTRLAIPGGRLGVLLSPTNVWRLALLVGHGLARDFLLTGREVSGEVAERLGLVQRLADDPLAAAHELAAHIASLAPLTVQGHKRALNAVTESLVLTDAARSELETLEAKVFASDDLAEGMAAFAEKRAPTFRGR
ncbi:MAG TPA: enoyl-CoA hydratase-related protein [Acidimicrobiia bacterium]